MSNAVDHGTPSVPEVRARLRDAARLLRDSDSLDANARDPLVELLDELSRALEAPDAPPAEVHRLAGGIAHLAESLRHGHDRGVLVTARDRLEDLVLHAEGGAPLAVGLAERVIDALANLGI